LCEFSCFWGARLQDGLKPLPFGLRDITRAPLPTDGIFFPPFREGITSMQPERLGTYTSTLNPGYDPALPLYEPWAMFDAIKAINATPSIPYNIPNNIIQKEIEKPVAISTAIILASGESQLKEQWQKLGIPLGEITKKTIPSLLIIDGNHPPIDLSSKQLIDACLNNDGTVLVWGASPESKD
jgi:beta-galactosidase